MKIEMITELDKGIYRSDRLAWSEPEIMEATRANLAYMLDWRDYRLIETQGCFGSIGMGETNVYLVNGDKRVLITAENEDDIYDSIDIEGRLTDAQLNEIRGKIWDGNNHVTFIPERSTRHCDEPHTEEYNWGSVTFNNDGSIDSFNVSDGWVILGGLDYGGYWSDSELSREEFNYLREAYYLRESDSIAEFEIFDDDDNETVALLATDENYRTIREYFDNFDNQE